MLVPWRVSILNFLSVQTSLTNTCDFDRLQPNGFSAWEGQRGIKRSLLNNCQQILIGPTDGIETKEMDMPAIQYIEKQLAIWKKEPKKEHIA